MKRKLLHVLKGTMTKKSNPAHTWLRRDYAATGPYLTLVLCQQEFDAVLSELGEYSRPFIACEQSNATAHMMTRKNGELCQIIALRDFEGKNPIIVAGILVHEAVHVWQNYAAHIGEHSPGAEQEAYAIQNIAQFLMQEYARRITQLPCP